jgi:hypothetical protein
VADIQVVDPVDPGAKSTWAICSKSSTQGDRMLRLALVDVGDQAVFRATTGLAMNHILPQRELGLIARQRVSPFWLNY